MGLIAKTCGLVTVVAALNWAALMLFQADMRRYIDQGEQVTQGAGVVVALASLYLLLALVKGKRKH